MGKIFTKSEKMKEEYCCSVVRIGEVKPIEGSDFLGRTLVNGFDIVVRKDEVKEGDVLVYASLETQLKKEYLAANNLFEMSAREQNSNYETVKTLIAEGNKDEAKKLCGYFNKHGRVVIVKLKGVPSKGFLFGLDSLVKWKPELAKVNLEDYVGQDFDEIDGELFVKAYVKPAPTQGKARSKEEKRQAKIEKFDKMIPGQFEFHYDTKQLEKNMWKLKPEDNVHVSIKIHGTSFISGKVKIKVPIRLSKFEKFINKCCRKLKQDIKYPEYEYTYENIYSSRGVIKNQYINENPGQGFYKFDVYTKYGKMLDPYIPQGVTVYGEIAGYFGNGEEMAQKKYDYGCEVGQGFLMPYRITSTNEDGTKREWDMEEVNAWTNALIQWAQVNGDTELASSLRPTYCLYHGRLTDLYPEISTTEHWHENVLEAMKKDTEHFGMEQMETLCTHFDVPREGICIRIDGDPESECFKLKTDAFRFFEKKCYDNGEVDREVEENAGYEVEEV